MNFKDYLEEQKEKHAVLAFGRMNPPTTGHAKLVDKVKDIAKDVGGSHHIVLSHSQDEAKNPLTAEQKVKHAKRYFPDTNISTSSKEHPNFLSQASKLHKAGVTHLHMVAGSDRTEEYHKTLHKYNGVKGTHGYFKFKDIKVHSAGERDPDAEGVEGMSASKMREHAKKGNFKEFKKGVPSHVAHEHAKDLYNDVRKGMNIKEDFQSQLQTILAEGVHDRGIFKAVFLSGGPGSGKDYVLDNTLSGHGMVEINSDKALEFLMDKNNLSKKMPESEKELRDVVRGRAKDITELKQRLALLGRNGLIINGTGDDPQKYAKIKKNLESIGYETSMVAVVTKDEISAKRNIERGQRGGRTVPEKIRKEKWDAVNNARPEMAKLFGKNYIEFDNSEDLRNAAPEVVQAKKEEMTNIFKQIQDFVKKPPKSEEAKQWVAGELAKKDTLPVKKGGAEQVAPKHHEDAGIADKARELGLQYYGFGRYGKNGKVTHHSVHGQLVADPTHVEQQKAQQKAEKVKAMQSSGSPMKEDVNKDFANLFEAVSVTIKADTPEELKQAMTMLTGNGEQEEPEEVEEQKSFTNDGAFNALTLGKPMMVFEDLRQWFSKSHPEGGWKRINSKGEAIGPCAREPGEPKPKCMSNEKRAQLSKKERASAVAAKRRHDPEADRAGKGGKPVNVSNFGKGKISETYTGMKKIKHTDGNHYVALGDKPRLYILRNNAAKDAHRNSGEVVKVDKGYMVKLKENNDATIFQRPIEETNQRTTITSSGWSDSQGTITVPAGSGTVTISEARATRTDTSASTGSRTSTLTEHCGSPEAHIGDGSAYDPTKEKSTKGKITLNKIKENFKQKVKESIDKGIEPGISMAGAGESIGRDMGEKNDKKGKVTVVKELTGDETTASIGDQKEDELKKQGISLSSFKKKNYL